MVLKWFLLSRRQFCDLRSRRLHRVRAGFSYFSRSVVGVLREVFLKHFREFLRLAIISGGIFPSISRIQNRLGNAGARGWNRETEDGMRFRRNSLQHAGEHGFDHRSREAKVDSFSDAVRATAPACIDEPNVYVVF